MGLFIEVMMALFNAERIELVLLSGREEWSQTSCVFHQVGEGGVQSTLFYIFNYCYFISSPNKLKFCHKIKKLCIHISCQNMKTTPSRKKIAINLKRVLFLSRFPKFW